MGTEAEGGTFRRVLIRGCGVAVGTGIRPVWEMPAACCGVVNGGITRGGAGVYWGGGIGAGVYGTLAACTVLDACERRATIWSGVRLPPAEIGRAHV